MPTMMPDDLAAGARPRRSRTNAARPAVLAGLATLAGLAIGTSTAGAVPITVPRIVVNDGVTLRVEGTISSPPSASNCTALVRVQLQVIDYRGYWRVVRAIGRHRIDVCQGDDSGWTYGDLWARFPDTWRLRSQRARVCWAATQTVNGLPSTHAACKRFWLVGGS